jgi:hypothetical protein
MHTRGSVCKECCCAGPYKHENCTGYLHEQLADDDPDEGYIHIHKCDACDYEEKYWADEDCKILFK